MCAERSAFQSGEVAHHRGGPRSRREEGLMTARTGSAPRIAARWRSWTPYLLSVLRIIAALLFIQFGTAKLFGFPAPIMPGGGTAPVGSLAWWASVFETFG